MGLTAQDHEDIRTLLARYNLAIDLGDAEAWADTFTDDGVFECVGLPENSPNGGRYEGRADLVAYATAHYGLAKGRARHWNWNLLIEGDHSDATMTSYLNAMRAGLGDRAKVEATGIYRDRLRKIDDEWKFTSRKITIDND